MILLSAETGEILLRQDTGFKAEKNTSLWACKEYLLFFSCQDSAIGVYKDTGEPLGVIHIPDPYTVRPCAVPYYLQDKIYVQLVAKEQTLVPILYGLLVIDPDELASGDYQIQFEPQPDLVTQVVDDGEGNDRYEVTIHHDSLDDVLRFGEIELKRIAAVYGKQVYPSKQVNPRFAGQIIYNIDEQRLKNPDTAKLDILVARVHHLVSLIGGRAGNGKDWRYV
jgi:hypothetical protein